MLPLVNLGLALLLLTAAGLPVTPKEPVTSPPAALHATVCRAGNLWAEEVEFAEDSLVAAPKRDSADRGEDAALLRCDSTVPRDSADDGDVAETRMGPASPAGDAAAHCEGPRLPRGRIGRCDMQRVGRPLARLHAGDEHHGRGILVFLAGTVHRSLRAARPTPPDERSGDRSLLGAARPGAVRLSPIGLVADPALLPLQPGQKARIDRPPR
jgi:hypothetical protein